MQRKRGPALVAGPPAFVVSAIIARSHALNFSCKQKNYIKRMPKKLIHPAFVIGIFSQFVGVDVPSLFVEVNLAVLLAHVDLELSCGTAAFAAIVCVADPV